MAVTGPNRRRSVTIVPQTLRPLYDAFTFDLVDSMQVTFGGVVQTHPVQGGSEGIADAVRIDPPDFSLSGTLANTPIVFATGIDPTSSISQIEGDRMITLLEQLLKIRALKVPVTVLTSWLPPLWDRWPAIVGAKRDASSGNTIPVTATLPKVRRVRSQVLPTEQDSDIVALAQQEVEYGPIAVEGGF